MEKYITKRGNDLLINLYPVNIQDLEEIATAGSVLSPKSTWFDPNYQADWFYMILQKNKKIGNYFFISFILISRLDN